uniref:Putative glycosyltransferase n=1 Tax=Aspergillus niger TaxID=5061 RepID=Q38JW1_ASPNG|nr:putative glycosyltransferase [Aspergillus niger]
MAVARSMRRTSPITVFLAALLAFGFLCFLLSPSSSAAARRSSCHRFLLAATTRRCRRTSPFSSDETLPQISSRPRRWPESTPARERVLILTPLARFYQEFWDNVVKLSYPHELISIGFIVPNTKDGHAAVTALEQAISETQSGPIDSRFRQHQHPSPGLRPAHSIAGRERAPQNVQPESTSLLFTTLGPSTSWVLWLDSDIVETPATLIQDLTAHNRPVIVPNCFQRYYNKDAKKMDVRPYDFNSWIDSSTAEQLAETMGPDEISSREKLDCPPSGTPEAHKAKFRGRPRPSREIELDGVGGTALLVKADVHRDGAMFPAFPFYHLVETEGFAKMAKRLGYSVYGLPDYFVRSPTISHPIEPTNAMATGVSL